ncbi:30S ribosome-binding factor RbfA [bacterium]|nr:30S ribosome-binding factor RbfA [bacterium]
MTQAILEVLSELIQTSVKDPRVGFVTLNQVKLNRDHSVAEVFFSVMGEEADPATSLKGLKKAKGFLQSRLSRTLGLRAAPDLRFVHDDSVAKAVDMGALLDDLKDQGEFLTEEEKKRRLTLDDIEPPVELLRGLRAGQRFWVVPHHNPDPDAMGSALAMAEALRAMGREVRVMGYCDPPIGLTNLPGFADVTDCEDADELFDEERPDTLLLVDCHRIDRCGPLEETLERFSVRWCIDHHLVSGRKAPEPGWVEARACSSCTLVHQVITSLGEGDGDDPPFDLTLDMATNLYAGLVTDTGGFRFSNTVPFTFEFARRLSELGVDTAAVSGQTLHRYRREGVAMLQRVLETFAYHAEGRILVAHATRAMLDETGAAMGDTEGFVNIATAVDGVEIVAFLKEIGDDTWRVSLRSRTGDVQQVAARHGGGGHAKAAGCTIEGAVDEVAAQLVAELTGTLAS